jgi:hypothetical protein
MVLASRVQEMYAQSRHLIATHRTWTPNWCFQYSYPHYNLSLFYTTSNAACFVKSPMCLRTKPWDTTPCILNLNTKRMVSFTRRSFYSQEKSPLPRNRTGKESGWNPKLSGQYGEHKHLFPLPRINPRFLGRPDRSPVTIPSESYPLVLSAVERYFLVLHNY